MKGNKTVYTVARIFLGLMLLVFGLNGYLQFFPLPEMNEAAMKVMEAFMATGFIMSLNSLAMIIVGAALLLDRYVPLAMIVFAPFSVNYVLFHLFLDTAGMAGAIIVFVLNLYIGIYHWDAYKSLFKAKA